MVRKTKVKSGEGDKAAALAHRRLGGGRDKKSTDSDPQGEPSVPKLIYEIVRHRGFWRTLHAGKFSPSYDNQEAAIAAAVSKAKQDVAEGRPALVRLKRTDGDERIVDLDEC